MNDDILAQIVSDLISDTVKFSLQFDEIYEHQRLQQFEERFQSKPACCIRALWERRREKGRFFYFVSLL